MNRRSLEPRDRSEIAIGLPPATRSMLNIFSVKECIHFKNGQQGARKLAQMLRAVDALAELPGSIFNNPTAAHNCL